MPRPPPSAVTVWGAAPHPTRPAVAAAAIFDAIVVGAGMAGLEAARVFARAGLRTAVLEAAAVGAGASGANLGLAVVGLGEPFAGTAERLGRDRAITIWRTHLANLRAVADRCAAMGVNCYRRTGFLKLARRADELDALLEGARDLARAGLRVRVAGAEEIARHGIAGVAGGIAWEDGGEIAPLRFVRAQAREAERLGVRIFERTAVESLEADAAGVRAETSAGRVRSRIALVAAGPASAALVEALRGRVMPFRAHAVATAARPGLARPPPGFVGRGDFCFRSVKGRLLAGADEPRPATGGGDGHAVGAALAKAIARHLPSWRRVPVALRWSGLLDVSVDGLPYIGPVRRGGPIVVACGFTGLGYGYALLAARWAARAALGRPDATPRLYRADRRVVCDPELPWEIGCVPGGRRT